MAHHHDDDDMPSHRARGAKHRGFACEAKLLRSKKKKKKKLRAVSHLIKMTHSNQVYKPAGIERKEGVGVTGEEVSELQGYVGTAATFMSPLKMTHCSHVKHGSVSHF